MKSAAVLLLWNLGAITALAGQAPIILTASQDKYPAGPHMEFLEDPGGELSFEDISQSPARERFAPLNRDDPNFSFSRSAFWMKLEITNETGIEQRLILHLYTPWIDSFDVYITRREGKTELRRSGEKYPFHQREIEHNQFLFPLIMAPNETVSVAMRAQSLDPLQLPLSIWKEEAFNGYTGRVSLYFGVVFGCLTAVLLYNLMLYFALRDKVYFHYILYVASLMFMIFTYMGYSYQYLWPQWPRWQNWMVFVSGYLAMFNAIFIAKSFLESARNLPRIHQALTVFQAICVIFPVGGYITDNYLFTSFSCSIAALLFPFLMGGAGVAAYLNRVRSARFFILAWASSLAGQLISMGTLFSITPTGEVYRRMMEVGFMVDAVLLSFALADRISILRLEKERAEELAIRALKASRDKLESQVADRTAELSMAKEKAESATRLKDKFVALVSHDLRAPLGSMITMLDQFRPAPEDPKSAELNRRLTSMALGAAKGMMEMIDNLLDLSRLRTGAITLLRKRLNAHNIVNQAISSLLPRANEKGVALLNHVPQNLTLFADPDLYTEVIQNILANAVKFCGKGDSVTIFNPQGTPGAVAVKDTGIGIPPELIGHIFDHNVKTTRPGTGGEKGTGLGLPLCQDIMATHGGSIHVESSPGLGSVFTIILPSPKAIVLLVDNQQAHRVEIKKIMRPFPSVSFLEAENGKEALTLLEETPPDLVIMDINMPDMEGLELISAIKRHPNLNQIPVIAATSSSMEKPPELRQRIFSYGADDFVTKPIVPEELIPRMIRFLPIG